MTSEPGTFEMRGDNVFVGEHPLFPLAGEHTEYAVRYRTPGGVMGSDKWHYIEVSDEAAAKNVASWHHQPWDDREKEMVRRTVSDWQVIG